MYLEIVILGIIVILEFKFSFLGGGVIYFLFLDVEIM